MNYADLRRDYKAKAFDIKDADENPFKQFENWFEDAMKAEIEEATAVALSTCAKEGKPSSRIVLLKGVDEKGFIFFTNYYGKKSKELEENPNASMLFFYKELHRQIRIEGTVERTTKEESENYFHSRPRESQIAAWTSQQSKEISGREHLEELFNKYSSEFEGKEIPLPNFWGGFRLIPDYFEFWQGRENRLHDRIRYQLKEKKWALSRIAP